MLLAAEVDNEGAWAVCWTQPVGADGLSGVVLEDILHPVPLVKVVASHNLLLAVSGGDVVQVVRRGNCHVNLVDFAKIEELDSPVVVSDGSVVVLQQSPEHGAANVNILRVSLAPECLHLSGGYLDGSEEVDPLDALRAGGRGEGARVGGVGGGGGRAQGSHASQQGVQL